MDYAQQMKKILDTAISERASNVLISVDHPQTIRIVGQLSPLKEKKISPEDAKGLAFSLMNEDKKQKLLTEKEIDFSYDFDGKARFRINVFFQKDGISIALRLISPKIRTIEELNMPPVLHEFTNRSQGLVLVTGASGQGKSTTLAAMIDEINHTKSVHIITIEDPIEYVYEDDRAIIDQREIGEDT